MIKYGQESENITSIGDLFEWRGVSAHLSEDAVEDLVAFSDFEFFGDFVKGEVEVLVGFPGSIVDWIL